MSTDVYHLIRDVWLVGLVVWVIAAFTSKRTVRRQSIGSRLGQLALGIIAALLLFQHNLPFAFLYEPFVPHSPMVADIGLALTIAGVGCAIWARFTLGRNWSGTVTVKQNHELIRSGPYSIVRHPIYSSILLAFFGTVLAIGQVRGLTALAIIVLTFRLKSLTEESFMVQQFGARYVTYKREVKALIPYVW